MSSSRPLTRLQLDADAVAQLAAINVVTAVDLFKVNPLIVLQHTRISLDAFRAIQQAVGKRLAPAPTTALELLQQRFQSDYTRVLSTNMPSLDTALHGGLLIGSITDICGLPGTGKTQFCMGVVVQALLRHRDRTVVFVDAELKMDPRRLLQLLSAAAPAGSLSQSDVESMLQRVLVKRPATKEDFASFVDGLQEEIIANSAILLVIDSLAAIARRASLQAQDLENWLVGTTIECRRVAECCGCAVVVTNQVAPLMTTVGLGVDEVLIDDRSGQKFEGALGVLWQHCVTCRITLQRLSASTMTHFEGYDEDREGGHSVEVGRLAVQKSPVAAKCAFFYVIGEGGLRTIT